MNQATATISENSPRALDWLGIFDRLHSILLQSPIPIRCDLPGKSGALCYMLDVKAITTDERQRLIDHIVRRFNLPGEKVEQDLDQMGMPILAEDVQVMIPAALAFSMMDDMADDDDWDHDTGDLTNEENSTDLQPEDM